MKKRIWILTLALALMLTGCGQKQAAPSEEAPQQGQEEPVQEEGQQAPDAQAIYEDAQISDQIHYPQLTQFQGELLLDYVNQSLARPAKELEGTEASLEYTVTRCDETWVSVLYTKTETAADGAQTKTWIAVNLDGATATEVTMDNAFSDPAAVLALLETAPEGAQVSFYLDTDGAVFFFRPEGQGDYVTQTVSYEDLNGLWNQEIGQRPAS